MGRDGEQRRDGAEGPNDAALPGPRWLAGSRRLARRILVAPIAAYRRWISPLKPATCRFSPTCSAYAHEAILRHGVVKGVVLAIWRILRCQPFARGGYDPVPVGRRHETCTHDDAASPPPAPRRSPDPPSR